MSTTSESLFTADARRADGARELGSMLLARMGKHAGTSTMPDFLKSAHERAAERGAIADLGRLATSPLIPDRLRKYASRSSDSLERLMRAAALPPSGERDILIKRHENALRSARDGLSRPNGRFNRPQNSDPFESQPVDDPQYHEPQGDPDAFHTSGRITSAGRTARQGYEYPADDAASPMERLFGPAANARDMNWDGDDDFGQEHDETTPAKMKPNAGPRGGWGGWGSPRQRVLTEGRVPQYRSDRSYRPPEGNASPSFESELEGRKFAYSSTTPLAEIAKGGSPSREIRKSLDVAFENRAALGEALYRDYVAMKSHIADARDPSAWRGSVEFRELIERIDRAAVSGTVKGALLSALAK